MPAGRPLAQALARFVLTVIVGLALWAAVPTLLGWRCAVVLTGSMQPALRVGDLVVTAPIGASKVAPGQIITLDNPARPGHLLLHRVMRIDGDKIITKGDANLEPDSTPATASQVRGLAAMRVPFLGLVAVWAHQGNIAALGGVLAVLLLLGTLATSPGVGRGSGTGRRPPAGGTGASADTATRFRATWLQPQAAYRRSQLSAQRRAG